jgi:protein involved in polysaccharide export with SLBB domain
LSVVAAADLYASASMAQEAEPYTRGDRKRLLIMVHVLGEVRNPGEYSVPDDTDLLGLIAKAGGSTEFGDLGQIRLTHRPQAQRFDGTNGTPAAVGTEMFDLEAYLRGQAAPPPVLQPGDVVTVARNSWASWRTVAAVFRDLAVVASAVFLGMRAFDNN